MAKEQLSEFQSPLEKFWADRPALVTIIIDVYETYLRRDVRQLSAATTLSFREAANITSEAGALHPQERQHVTDEVPGPRGSRWQLTIGESPDHYILKVTEPIKGRPGTTTIEVFADNRSATITRAEGGHSRELSTNMTDRESFGFANRYARACMELTNAKYPARPSSNSASSQI